MWKIAFLGTILGAAGLAVLRQARPDWHRDGAFAAAREEPEEPGNVVSIEEFRERRLRQEGRPADALRVARAAVDLRMRDVIERDAA